MFTIDDVKKIEWIQVEPEPLGGDLADDLGKIINKFVKYAIKDWWKEKGFHKENMNEYLTFKFPEDKTVRQAIYMAKTIAASVKFKIFSEEKAGCKLFFARDRYMKLLRSCLKQHASNSNGGWGLCDEQISLVTELLFTCWIVWDKLNIQSKQFAVNVLESELERMKDFEIEYKFNPDGSIRSTEDCPTIVNMDAANFLYLASVMTGNISKIGNAAEKAILAYRSCFASKNDGDIEGYNVADDMLIYREGTRSPFATSYIGKGIKAFVFSKIAISDLPSGVARNFENIYKAFNSYTVDESGKKKGLFTFYDNKNHPNGNVVYPDGIRGGKVNESALYAMDIFAYCLGYENSVEPNSREWARLRMKIMEKNFSRNQKYANQGCSQYRNLHGEAVCSELVDCYLALFLHLVAKKSENNFIDKFSREEYGENDN